MKNKPALAAATAILLATAATALASGDYGPSYTMFKAYTKPDIPLARFQAGELGVLQPGMRRVYLYAAWRAIMLGPAAAQSPGTPQGLARADGSAFAQGWIDADSPEGKAEADMVRRGAAAMGLAADDPAARWMVACAPAANAQARATLAQLAARPDASRARVEGWLRAQYQVGEACQRTEDARYQFGEDKRPPLAAPQPLPASEPAYWRQLRDYQRAAWSFHGERYADSTALFERIGATAGHPMQGLGAYLALRSEVRRAVADAREAPPAQREARAQALERRGAAVLADAALQSMHEATRALLRSMRAALTPETRLEELSRYLDDPKADPYALDRLGDWSVLMDGAAPRQAQARAGHAFADWIETLRACGYGREQPSCAAQAGHALARWKQGAQRPWLVAALMLSETMAADVEQAALAVPAGDPAWVTVRYHLARLYRLQGKAGPARAIADEALRRTLSPATCNLLREERFALATSVRDAGAYLLRTNVDYAGMGDGTAGGNQEDMINDDGLAWFKRHLAVADMVELARLETLPAPLRARIAGAAWIRAGLLDLPRQGNDAAALLAALAPELADAAARYRQAPSAAQRRHVVLVAAMRYGLGAELPMHAEKVARVPDEEAVASMWCSFRAEPELAAPGFPWRLPPPPQVGDAAALRAELAQLAPLRTATGVVGDDVLARASSQPADPELPWLLSAVVRSTRGGCLDPDAKGLSRKAFTLLHKRFPGNAWAKKTPYFY
ncbi:hypothetical protein [uncultured Massilia sp.]|uniref:hypothetical protein n=1 Tax=uncultured Massilia sp. TaxID=169973 RepID=UPI0025F1CCB9|nr:hypothetical protein [uncultured Massilia sp.]